MSIYQLSKPLGQDIFQNNWFGKQVNDQIDLKR